MHLFRSGAGSCAAVFAPVGRKQIETMPKAEEAGTTWVPRSQETPPSQDPTVGLYPGFYGGPRGRGCFL